MPAEPARRYFIGMSAAIEMLSTIAIFKDLTPEELGRVSELCEERKYESGVYVFHEGEPGNRLFIITEGAVRISRQIPGAGEEALAVLKKGSLFGEMAVFDKSERSTDAIADGGVTVLDDLPPGVRDAPGVQQGARHEGAVGGDPHALHAAPEYE